MIVMYKCVEKKKRNNLQWFVTHTQFTTDKTQTRNANCSVLIIMIMIMNGIKRVRIFKAKLISKWQTND